jgi:hypothetical protein
VGAALLALGFVLFLVSGALSGGDGGVVRMTAASVSAEITDICGAIASVLGVLKLAVELMKSIPRTPVLTEASPARR